MIKELLDSLLGKSEGQKLTKEELESIAGELSKHELKLSDNDIKRIAHNVIDSDRDVDRLAFRLAKTRWFKLWIPLAVLAITALGLLSIGEIVQHLGKAQLVRVQEQVDRDLDDFRAKVHTTLESTYNSVTNNIALKFLETNIQHTIESVAKEETTALLLTNINPTISDFENKLTNSYNSLKATMDALHVEATTNVTDLKAIADFYLLVLRAQGYDKNAFFQLAEVANDNKNPLRTIANAICANVKQDVQIQVAIATTFNFGMDPWEGTTLTSNKATFEQFASSAESMDCFRLGEPA